MKKLFLILFTIAALMSSCKKTVQENPQPVQTHTLNVTFTSAQGLSIHNLWYQVSVNNVNVGTTTQVHTGDVVFIYVDDYLNSYNYQLEAYVDGIWKVGTTQGSNYASNNWSFTVQ